MTATVQQPLERDAYLKERESLVKLESEQCQQFDKAILTLSGSALGLSLTFIRELVPAYAAGTLTLLIASWALFISSLLMTLVSFQTSQVALRRARYLLDLLHTTPTEATSINRAAGITKHLNIGATVSFIVGAMLLACFIVLNLPMKGTT